mgnify:FL=1
MCSILEEKERGGNARQAQMKRWEKFFRWKKEGHKFIITEILDRAYFMIDDNHFSNSYEVVKERGYCNIFDRHKTDFAFLKLFNKAFDFYFPETSKTLNTQRFVYLALGYYAPFSKRIFKGMYTELSKENLTKREDIKEILEYWKEFLEEVFHELPIRFKKTTRKTLKTKIPTLRKRHVYRFKNKLGEVIYVGKTSTSLYQRLYQHFNNGHLDKAAYQEVDTIEYLTFSTRLLMDQTELYFIVKYQPVHNTVQKHDEFIKLDLYESFNWVPIERESVVDLKRLLT